jgi:hypothetical protein
VHDHEPLQDRERLREGVQLAGSDTALPAAPRAPAPPGRVPRAVQGLVGERGVQASAGECGAHDVGPASIRKQRRLR